MAVKGLREETLEDPGFSAEKGGANFCVRSLSHGEQTENNCISSKGEPTEYDALTSAKFTLQS